MGRQHQGMDRPGVRQVPVGSGEQGKMEKTVCKIIFCAPTTLAVKELMMMMMMSVVVSGLRVVISVVVSGLRVVMSVVVSGLRVVMSVVMSGLR